MLHVKAKSRAYAEDIEPMMNGEYYKKRDKLDRRGRRVEIRSGKGRKEMTKKNAEKEGKELKIKAVLKKYS